MMWRTTGVVVEARNVWGTHIRAEEIEADLWKRGWKGLFDYLWWVPEVGTKKQSIAFIRLKNKSDMKLLKNMYIAGEICQAKEQDLTKCFTLLQQISASYEEALPFLPRVYNPWGDNMPLKTVSARETSIGGLTAIDPMITYLPKSDFRQEDTVRGVENRQKGFKGDAWGKNRTERFDPPYKGYNGKGFNRFSFGYDRRERYNGKGFDGYRAPNHGYRRPFYMDRSPGFREDHFCRGDRYPRDIQSDFESFNRARSPGIPHRRYDRRYGYGGQREREYGSRMRSRPADNACSSEEEAPRMPSRSQTRDGFHSDTDRWISRPREEIGRLGTFREETPPQTDGKEWDKRHGMTEYTWSRNNVEEMHRDKMEEPARRQSHFQDRHHYQDPFPKMDPAQIGHFGNHVGSVEPRGNQKSHVGDGSRSHVNDMGQSYVEDSVAHWGKRSEADKGQSYVEDSVAWGKRSELADKENMPRAQNAWHGEQTLKQIRRTNFRLAVVGLDHPVYRLPDIANGSSGCVQKGDKVEVIQISGEWANIIVSKESVWVYETSIDVLKCTSCSYSQASFCPGYCCMSCKYSAGTHGPKCMHYESR